jgi:hypothetical protein
LVGRSSTSGIPGIPGIPGNQRTIDGAGRDAGDPVGMKIGLRQRLVDASLIRAKRATALKQQRNAPKGRARPRA